MCINFQVVVKQRQLLATKKLLNDTQLKRSQSNHANVGIENKVPQCRAAFHAQNTAIDAFLWTRRANPNTFFT